MPAGAFLKGKEAETSPGGVSHRESDALDSLTSLQQFKGKVVIFLALRIREVTGALWASVSLPI